MEKKPYVMVMILAVLAACIVYAVIFFIVENANESRSRKALDAKVSVSVSRSAEGRSAASAGKHRKVLKVTTPEEAGIKVISKNEMPDKPQEWNKVVADILPEAKKQLAPEEAAKITSSLKPSDPAKIAEQKEKIQKLDEVVKELQDRLDKNPSDQEAKDKLEKINMFKGILNAMDDNFK